MTSPPTLTIEQLRAEIESGAIDTVITAITDMQGRLQGKRNHGQFFLDHVLGHGVEGCNYLMAVDVEMNTVDGYAISSWERGYGDMLFELDMSTLRRTPGQPHSATVQCDPPRVDADAEMARAIVSRLDGLILGGGADVEPARYAAQPHPRVQEARPDRDAFELALAAVTRQLDTPVLGICRGMEVMAVAAGGTLHQHLPDVVGHEEHSPGPGAYGSHSVRTVEGTTLSALLGQEVVIPSYHHQSVATHPGYVPAAWAPDGTLEAMEHPASRLRLAVQWHPKAGDDTRLFDALIRACAPPAPMIA